MVGFKEAVLKLSEQVVERKEHVTNEEMTKQALIIPFIQTLGYDIFNPLEVKSEYDSDIGRKKGEKVDYAIFKDGNPIIFIEAKPVTDKLTSHNKQLARYYNVTTNVRLAILTNGIEYKFFTDLDTSNIMDENPFLQLDITDISEIDLDTLTKFTKDTFETETVVKYAEELTYTSNLNKKLKEIFKNPPDEFIRYLIKDFSDTRITTNVIEKFRPIVKKSISRTLLDMVSQSLAGESDTDSTEETINMAETEVAATTDLAPVETATKPKRVIVTTEEELEAYENIRNILSENGRNINVSEVNYKDTTVYFAIYNRVTTNWIVRLVFDAQNKNILTKLPLEKLQSLAPGYKCEVAPKGYGESRLYLNPATDILKLTDVIIACYDLTVE